MFLNGCTLCRHTHSLPQSVEAQIQTVFSCPHPAVNIEKAKLRTKKKRGSWVNKTIDILHKH